MTGVMACHILRESGGDPATPQPMKTFAFLSIAAAAVVGAMTSVDLVKKGDHNAAALFAGFTAFAAASSVCTIGSIIDEA